MSNGKMEDVIKMLKLSHVPRWSIVDTIKDQSVADHSFRTTAIFLHMVEELNISLIIDWPKYIIDVLKHDMDEALTGDMPTTDKRKNGVLSKPQTPEELLLKIADCVEAYIFAYRYAIVKDNIIKDVRENMNGHIERLQKILDAVRTFGEPTVGTVVNQLIWAGINYD